MDDLKVALEELKDESDSGRLLIRQEHKTSRRHPAVLTLIAAISIAIVAAGLWFFLWGRVKFPTSATIPPAFSDQLSRGGRNTQRFPPRVNKLLFPVTSRQRTILIST